jgi:hypothetical protein
LVTWKRTISSSDYDVFAQRVVTASGTITTSGSVISVEIGAGRDDNGNLLTTGVMSNTWDAANRLVETQRDEVTLEPIYNGVGDRVGQTVGTTTTHFALDVAGGLGSQQVESGQTGEQRTGCGG